MRSYLFVYLIEEKPDGFAFRSRDWPLHLTLLPPFSIDMPADDLWSLTVRELNGLPAITTHITCEAIFGRGKKVQILDKPAELQSLHITLRNLVDSRGALHKSPHHLDAAYKPHITNQQGRTVALDRKIILDSVSLVEVFSPGNIPNRKIYKTLQLVGRGERT